jgi:ribosomal subunit interface protein
MRVPLEIAFKNVEPTSAMETLVRERVDRLARYHRDIITCRVAVEAPHLSPNEEALGHRIRIEVSVPGDEVIVSRDRSHQREQYDPYQAIREAFQAAEKQLRSYSGPQRRGRHPRVGPPHAVVDQLMPDEDYGFLSTPDGRNIYFHRNSVVNDGFDDLSLGDEVRFEERMGDEGPQASTVAPVGRHGHHELT